MKHRLLMALGVIAAAVCFFMIGRQAEAADFTLYTGEYESGGAGAKFTVRPNDENKTATLLLQDVKTGTEETYSLVLPDTVTSGETIYTVTSFGESEYASSSSLGGKIASLTVGEHLREISGNLFPWHYTRSGISPSGMAVGYATVAPPDTAPSWDAIMKAGEQTLSCDW